MASSIVKSAAQQLGNLLVEETKYLYNVKGKIESLQMELQWMECFLRDADTQQHQEKLICMWVSQIRDLAYDAEDIIERYIYEVSHHRRDGIRNTLKWFSCMLYTCDGLVLHDLGSKIDDLTIKMSELTSRLQRYGIQIIKPTRSLESYDAMIREQRRTYSNTKEDVVGLDGDIKQVIDQLLRENFKVVGISGTGGLGKTTLARKVFLDKRIQERFNNNCWVYISREFEPKHIFQEILIALNKNKRGELMSLGFGELVGMINEVLLTRPCLVVLDDMWTTNAWDILKPAFESVVKSRYPTSKILITTRNQGLLQHADPFGYLHLLQPLSFEYSWKLFQQKAFTGYASTDDDEVKAEMEKLGRYMLKHCDGLPLAIVALGGILCTKRTVYEWKEVETNITSYIMSGEEGHGSGQAVQVLELSYHDLPYYLKPCFLYLGNYPEDCEISATRLYRLWGAEGLLAEGEAQKAGGGSNYDVGERYLNELVQRSMVQVGECRQSGRVKSFRVHDIIRDMCLNKCEEVNFLNTMDYSGLPTKSVLSKLASSSAQNKRMRRCSVYRRDYVFTKIEGKNGEKDTTCVRSILVFLGKNKCKDKLSGQYDDEIIPEKIWKCFPLLRVLDLRESVIGRFPKGIEKLIHLRYLSLKWTYFEELPSCFLEMKCLETLDLRTVGATEVKLPSDFQKLERLRHFYLPNEIKFESDDEMMTFPVTRLETLKNFNPKAMEMEDLLKMTNLRVFSLHPHYHFEEEDDLKAFLEAPVMKEQGRIINTFTLNINANLLKKKPDVLSSLQGHPGSFKLNIWGESGSNDTVGNETADVVLPDCLIEVELYNLKVKEGGLLSALEKLPNLNYLNLAFPTTGNHMSFSPGSFPHLKHLRIWCAVGLREWVVGDGALRNLQRLEIGSCRQLRTTRGLSNSIQIEGDWERHGN